MLCRWNILAVLELLQLSNRRKVGETSLQKGFTIPTTSIVSFNSTVRCPTEKVSKENLLCQSKYPIACQTFKTKFAFKAFAYLSIKCRTRNIRLVFNTNIENSSL